MKKFLCILALGITSPLVACASSASGPGSQLTSPTGDGGATPPTLAAGDLGGYCELAGSPGHVSAVANAKCTLGTCVYDGTHPVTNPTTKQTSYETYCSADCTAAMCPTGWDCTPADGDKRVCTKQPAVCGDGVVQMGEACDDGNTSSRDSCSADCTQALPSSLDVLSWSWNNVSRKQWFPRVPVDEGSGSYALIDEITPESLRLVFGMPYSNDYPAHRWELRIPRTAGVVDPADPKLGFLTVSGGAGTFPLSPRTMEVVSVSADGRSLHVRTSGSFVANLAADFVVTLP